MFANSVHEQEDQAIRTQRSSPPGEDGEHQRGQHQHRTHRVLKGPSEEHGNHGRAVIGRQIHGEEHQAEEVRPGSGHGPAAGKLTLFNKSIEYGNREKTNLKWGVWRSKASLEVAW